jgi:DNA-binding winged helix-turn-helix (wHTH) protein
MSSPLTLIYEFDRFRLDRGNQRLTRDGLLLSTPGRAFPLLLELIQNREQIVSIEKLVNSLFPKSPFGEEELATEVLKLKRLLDDTSKQAPIIRSVFGKGYQFEAEVTEYLGDSSSDQQFGNKVSDAEYAATFSKPPQPAKGRGGMIGGIAAGVILVAALGVGVWRYLPSSHGGSVNSGIPQVAVLPFQSLTGAATTTPSIKT